MEIMPTSIRSLPEELLLIIFKLVLAASNSVHARATLALVCRHWRDVIYHASILWTTIRPSVWCRRTQLCLTKSQELPIDVDMNFIETPDKWPREAIQKILKHLHRWRSANLCTPFEQMLLDGLAHPAPLLENLKIKRFYGQTPFLDPFKRQAPRLRSVSLSWVAIPWSTEMLCGLEDLDLGYIRSGCPTAVELTAILNASPRLSSLKLHDINFTPLFDERPINLPLLQILEIEELPSSFVSNFLYRLKSGHCRILRIQCQVNEEEESIFESLPALIPLMNTSDCQAEVFFFNWKVSYTLTSTSDQYLRLVLDGFADESIYLHRLIHETLPAEFLEVETWLGIELHGEDQKAPEWVNVANAMHITSVDITSMHTEEASDIIIGHLAEPVEGRWVLPFLQTVTMDIEDLSAEKLAEMVKNRHGLGELEGPLPMPFTSLSITGAWTEHMLDRAIIESVIGSEKLTWEMNKLELEETEVIEE